MPNPIVKVCKQAGRIGKTVATTFLKPDDTDRANIHLKRGLIKV
jgi:hypothetical protein